MSNQSAQNLSAQNLSIENLSAQNLSTQNPSQQKFPVQEPEQYDGPFKDPQEQNVKSNDQSNQDNSKDKNTDKKQYNEQRKSNYSKQVKFDQNRNRNYLQKQQYQQPFNAQNYNNNRNYQYQQQYQQPFYNNRNYQQNQQIQQPYDYVGDYYMPRKNQQNVERPKKYRNFKTNRNSKKLQQLKRQDLGRKEKLKFCKNIVQCQSIVKERISIKQSTDFDFIDHINYNSCNKQLNPLQAAQLFSQMGFNPFQQVNQMNYNNNQYPYQQQQQQQPYQQKTQNNHQLSQSNQHLITKDPINILYKSTDIISQSQQNQEQITLFQAVLKFLRKTIDQMKQCNDLKDKNFEILELFEQDDLQKLEISQIQQSLQTYKQYYEEYHQLISNNDKDKDTYNNQLGIIRSIIKKFKQLVNLKQIIDDNEQFYTNIEQEFSQKIQQEIYTINYDNQNNKNISTNLEILFSIVENCICSNACNEEQATKLSKTNHTKNTQSKPKQNHQQYGYTNYQQPTYFQQPNQQQFSTMSSLIQSQSQIDNCYVLKQARSQILLWMEKVVSQKMQKRSFINYKDYLSQQLNKKDQVKDQVEDQVKDQVKKDQVKEDQVKEDQDNDQCHFKPGVVLEIDLDIIKHIDKIFYGTESSTFDDYQTNNGQTRLHFFDNTNKYQIEQRKIDFASYVKTLFRNVLYISPLRSIDLDIYNKFNCIETKIQNNKILQRTQYELYYSNIKISDNRIYLVFYGMYQDSQHKYQSRMNILFSKFKKETEEFDNYCEYVQYNQDILIQEYNDAISDYSISMAGQSQYSKTTYQSGQSGQSDNSLKIANNNKNEEDLQDQYEEENKNNNDYDEFYEAQSFNQQKQGTYIQISGNNSQDFNIIEDKQFQKSDNNQQNWQGDIQKQQTNKLTQSNIDIGKKILQNSAKYYNTQQQPKPKNDFFTVNSHLNELSDPDPNPNPKIKDDPKSQKKLQAQDDTKSQQKLQAQDDTKSQQESQVQVVSKSQQ